MSNNGKSNLLIILALLVGISGVGLGTYSAFFQAPIAGPPGQDGSDGADGIDGVDGVDGIDGINGTDGIDGTDGINGTDGADAPGGIVVGILDPDNNDVIMGMVEIRALIAGSNQYSVSVLRNGTEIATEVPFEWNTTLIADGWWNLTVKVFDIPSGNETQDQAMVYVLNNPENNHFYYCSSEAEINAALADIGSQSGTITITENINLTDSIVINQGGSYIIQGIAPDITIDCNGDRYALRIQSSTQSCIVKDLTIDATDIIGDTQSIISVGSPFTYIENVKIFGDSDRKGRGIYIYASNVWVSNCHINELYYGIYGSGAHYAHISDNTILYCSDGVIGGRGIYLGGYYSTCDNNYIAYCGTGISATGYQLTVSNNVLYHNFEKGVNLYTDHSTLSGNSIRGYDPISGNGFWGIYMDGGDYNVLTGNLIFDFANSGPAIARGIYISSSYSEENTIVGNTILNCDIAIEDLGTNTYIDANNIL